MGCDVEEEAVGMVSASSDVKGSDNKVAGMLVYLRMHLLCQCWDHYQDERCTR